MPTRIDTWLAYLRTCSSTWSRRPEVLVDTFWKKSGSMSEEDIERGPCIGKHKLFQA